MRVSTPMFAQQAMDFLSRASERLLRLQGQIASGKTVRVPSDDPAAAGRISSLRLAQADLQRYAAAAQQAASRLQATDAALGSLSDALREAQRLALEGANSPDAAHARTLSTMVEQVRQRALAIANSKSSGTYLFGGRRTLTLPFSEAAPGGPVTYSGDSGAAFIEVAPQTTVQVNVAGDTLMNMGGAAVPTAPDLFATLAGLRDELTAGDSAAVQARIAQLDALLQHVLGLRAEAGGASQRAALAGDWVGGLDITLQALLSEQSDLDLAKAVVALKTAENIYQATAAVAADTWKFSLLDYWP